MATPAQLVETVSSATGVPLATIVDIDRKLVMAKLRTKFGRGLHAAPMTPLDAARLLTAVLASPQANVAAEAVERYALTSPNRKRSSKELFASAGLCDLAALPARHSFVKALTAIIMSAASGSVAALVANEGRDWSVHIEVVVFTRPTCGRIMIFPRSLNRLARVEYYPSSAATRRSANLHRIHPERGSGDLEQSRRITERTILPIARLLTKEDQ
jgi:hypothetical protein